MDQVKIYTLGGRQMEIVANSKGKKGALVGGMYSIEDIITRYPQIAEKAKEKYDQTLKNKKEEIMEKLYERVGVGKTQIVSKLLEELEDEELIELFVMQTTEMLIVSQAIEAVIEKGNITFEKALSQVILTEKEETEIIDKVSEVLEATLKEAIVVALVK